MSAARRFLLLGAILALAPHMGWPAVTASAAADRDARGRIHVREFFIEGNTLIPTERLLAVLAPYAGENSQRACKDGCYCPQRGDGIHQPSDGHSA